MLLSIYQYFIICWLVQLFIHIFSYLHDHPLFSHFLFAESIAATPDEIPEIKVALAWANRDDMLSSTGMHLPSSTNNLAALMSSPSSSTSMSSMNRGETYNIFEIIEKLQHESNIFLQADYLNFIYNEQLSVQMGR